MSFNKTSALEQLLGCYFHQDWASEFDDDVAAFQAIILAESQEMIAEGLGEINILLATELSENDLRKMLVDQIACYFDPSSDGLTDR